MVFLWLFFVLVSNFLMFFPFPGANISIRFLYPFIVNLTFLIAGYIFYRYSKNKKELMGEIELTRSELTQALKEAFEYTKVLEETNKKITELEAVNIDDQEQINEILSELAMYTNQLESIVNTIDSGICTIDKNGTIQSNFNKSFQKIFGDREYWESSIFDTIFYNLSSDKKDELKEFVDLAFSNTSTSDEMLNSANPVEEFIFIYNQEGKLENKYISTKVSRILNDKKSVDKLMFIFNDITLQKTLEENIKNQEQKYQDELNLLTRIFQHDKEIIVPFINDLNERIKIVKEKISEIEINTSSVNSLIEVQRLIHSIKGEAFTLGFDTLAKSCQNLEMFIKENYDSVIDTEKSLIIIEHVENLEHCLNKINDVAGKIFSYARDKNKKDEDKLELNNITVIRDVYDEFVRGFKDIIELYKKNELTEEMLNRYYENILKLDWIDMQMFKKELELITEKSSLQYKKHVDLNFIYEIQGIPIQKYKVLKEVFLHLIRNSIAHGIEEPEIRVNKGKEKIGKININIYEEDDNYFVRYSDDGKGFDIEKIKKIAVEKGLIDEANVNKIEDKDAIDLVFTDGFSVKEKIDRISGTGVGMSVIKNNIVYLLHGSISVTNKPSNGVSFLLEFPK